MRRPFVAAPVLVRHACRLAAHSRAYVARTSRARSSAAIDKLLEKPSWSTRSMLPQSTGGDGSKKPAITSEQLDHLLKLSALPSFKDEASSQAMLKDLSDQLHFVKKVQEVDTDGIEPLRNITQEQEGDDLIYEDAVRYGEELKQTASSGNTYSTLASRTRNRHYVVDGGLVNKADGNKTPT